MKVKFHLCVKSPRSLAYDPRLFHRVVELTHPPIVGVCYTDTLWEATPEFVSFDVDAALWEAWCNTEVPESEIDCNLLTVAGWIKDP